jgi:hypothetical protein
MQKVKTIDLLKEGTLLPPAADKCQVCAVKHHEAQPHNAESLYYKMWFKKQHDRWPTWKDAMAHCTEEMKAFWVKHLKSHGIDVK